MNVTVALWVPLVIAVVPVFLTVGLRSFRIVSRQKWDDLVADRNTQKSRADVLEDANDKLQHEVDRAEDRATIILELQRLAQGDKPK